MLPVECVVRGYLVGSGWKDYQATGAVCGLPLPEGLAEGDPLPEPLFTPATKAAVGDHDENISFDQVVELVGLDDAEALRDTSIALYRDAAAVAEERGLILADTKLEFGRGEAPGELVLADEAFTPDSSRYWDRERYEAGGADRLESFDKQIIRNWLSENWDKTGTPPELPGPHCGADPAALPGVGREADRRRGVSLNLDAGPPMSPVRPWHSLARPTGLVLSPLLLTQGRLARSKRGRLPNAPLPWSGTINGPRPLRLVGLGDSTIAGVGVDDPMLGLASQVLSRALSAHPAGRGVGQLRRARHHHRSTAR